MFLSQRQDLSTPIKVNIYGYAGQESLPLWIIEEEYPLEIEHQTVEKHPIAFV